MTRLLMGKSRTAGLLLGLRWELASPLLGSPVQPLLMVTVRCAEGERAAQPPGNCLPRLSHAFLE